MADATCRPLASRRGRHPAHLGDEGKRSAISARAGRAMTPGRPWAWTPTWTLVPPRSAVPAGVPGPCCGFRATAGPGGSGGLWHPKIRQWASRQSWSGVHGESYAAGLVPVRPLGTGLPGTPRDRAEPGPALSRIAGGPGQPSRGTADPRHATARPAAGCPRAAGRGQGRPDRSRSGRTGQPSAQRPAEKHPCRGSPAKSRRAPTEHAIEGQAWARRPPIIDGGRGPFSPHRR